MRKYKFTIHGNEYEVHIKNVEVNLIELEVNGSTYEVEVDKAIQPAKTPKLVRSRVETPSKAKPEEGTGVKTPASPTGKIKSPLPGTVIKIMVNEGDTVKVGQKLMMLDAMKMENNIDSDKDGKVVSIPVRPGQSVMEGDTLIEIGE
ncbi:MAG: biotin/lipoyl-containing protein [Bacteroidales bacterium]